MNDAIETNMNAEAIENMNGANGVASRPRKAKATLPSHESTVAGQLKTAKERAAKRLEEIRAEARELEELIGWPMAAVDPTRGKEPDTIPAPRRPAKVSAKVKAAKVAKSSGKGRQGPRGPRAGALPARVLAYLEGEPEGRSAGSVANALEIAVPKASQVLLALSKAGKVEKSGTRGAYLYAVSKGES